MTVKKRTWKDKKTGQLQTSWGVHIRRKMPDGTEVHVRKSSKDWTKKDAESYHRLVMNQLADGTFGQRPSEGRSITMDDFLEEYAQRHLDVRCAPSTVRTWRPVLDLYIRPFFGEMRLAEITQRVIEDFVKSQQAVKKPSGERRLANSTINKNLDLLSSILNKAKHWEYIDRVPKIERLTVRQASDGEALLFLDFGEAELFVAAAGDDAPILELGLHTGLRPGELLGLKWKDINFERKTLTVRRTRSAGDEGPTKAGYHRQIPLNRAAVEALRATERSRLRGPYVFSIADSGLPLTRKQLAKQVRDACQNAGIKVVTPKALRHTFASHLVMHNVSLEAVRLYLGHSSTRVTQRYVHLSPSWSQKTVERLCGDHDQYETAACRPITEDR